MSTSTADDRSLSAATRTGLVRRHITTVVLAAILGTGLAAVLPTGAHAAEPLPPGPAAGPIDPNTGYPFWYADSTGERFELCLDRPDTPAGLCLAAPQDAAARPWVDEDAARSNLAEDPETFWHNASAEIRQGGMRARFVAAQEATFGGADGAPRAGEQIAFGRVRVRLRGMEPNAEYTVTQPYGTHTYTADEEGDVFVTQDIGCLDVPCDFTKPHDSALASYLRWAPTTGSAAPAGYVGDPEVAHEVTGAPTGNNSFTVVGPSPGGAAGQTTTLSTSEFNVQGKLWNPTQPMLGLDSTQNLVDFGKVMLNAAAPPGRTVTLTNAGGGDEALRLRQLRVSGADAGQFALADDSCSNASLAPGATCTVEVSYTPAATPGAVHAQLDVPSLNGKDSNGGQRILLQGRVSDGTGKDARITGPISPVHGFPEWYQDENGARVALCDDQADPMCVLPDVPEGTYDPALPMSFPTNFPGELFWWNAGAEITDLTNTRTGADVRARLVLAKEAAFANEDAAPGDQVAFGRIRVRVSDLLLGQTYHVTTPYLERDFVAEDDGKGGGEINYTEDIGCLENPCNFDRVNQSNVGPFLRQVNAPEGYLGDPNVEDQIVDDPRLVSTEFSISGPSVTGSTDQFAVSGKLLAGQASGELRASSTTARVTPGSPATITLTNAGQDAATPQVTLPPGSGFTVSSDCPTTLVAGASCTVTVSLNGAGPGATTSLTVTNGDQPPIVIAVSRPGGGNPAPTAPALSIASDTGLLAGDNVTRLGAVTVAGAAASGQAVDVFVDGAPVTTVTAEQGTFTAPLTLGEGVHDVAAAYAGQPAGDPVTVRVDTTAPQVAAPRIDADLAPGSLAGRVTWSGREAAAFQVQVRRNGGAFTTVSLMRADDTSATYAMRSGDRYRFRVRAVDAAGNNSPWASDTVRASVVQERSAQVRFGGRWSRPSITASGDRVRAARVRGASATLRTRARAVQVVAPTGPQSGRAAILVDGRRVRTVDLYSARGKGRQTVATVRGLAPHRTSVVQVRVLDRKRRASRGTRIALDAFVVIR